MKHLRQLIVDSDASNVRLIDIPVSKFNKSLALNLGIYCSQAPSIFVLDADIMLRTDILTEAQPLLEDNSFVTVAKVLESDLPPASAESIATLMRHLGNDSFVTSIVQSNAVTLCFRDGTSVSIPTFKRYSIDGSRAGCGLLLVAKRHIVAIGGYNSALEHWGWEDNDVQLRLKRTLSLSEVEIGQAVHVTHGDDLRDLSGRSSVQTSIANFLTTCSRYAKGDFEGTYRDDLMLWKDRLKECNPVASQGESTS